VDWNNINSVINYQLLDFSTNRGSKNDKELHDWIRNDVKNQKEYLKIHLIPNDKELWKSNNFNDFLEERGKLIVNKLEFELVFF
jgi:hypothetical protein